MNKYGLLYRYIVFWSHGSLLYLVCGENGPPFSCVKLTLRFKFSTLLSTLLLQSFPQPFVPLPYHWTDDNSLSLSSLPHKYSLPVQSNSFPPHPPFSFLPSSPPLPLLPHLAAKFPLPSTPTRKCINPRTRWRRFCVSWEVDGEEAGKGLCGVGGGGEWLRGVWDVGEEVGGGG